jgi:hypothetical protein
MVEGTQALHKTLLTGQGAKSMATSWANFVALQI